MDPFHTYSFQELGTGVGPDDFALPVQILGTGRERQMRASYRWDNQRHRRRPFHVLQYTTAGRGWFQCAGETRAVGPGDLFTASWNQEFTYWHNGTDGPWEFRWIIVAGPLADQALGRLTQTGAVTPFGSDAAPVRLLENLHRRLELRDTWDRYALSAVGYELCLCLVRACDRAVRSAQDEVGREAAAWVRAHWTDADCPSMAARFGYNEKYFAEFLHRHTGMTPQKFIQDQKMRYACSLLTSTARTVGAISADLGFAEDNYFSKVFRKHTGLSPQEYRRRHQESLVFDELVPL